MKKLARIAFGFLAVMAIGCSSSDDNGGSSSDEIYLRWTEGGTSYDIEDVQTGTSLATAISGYQGIDDSFRGMTLWMPNNPTLGSHPLVYDNGSEVDIYSADFAKGDIAIGALSGTINITSLDSEYIKGTFSFSGTGSDGETYTITNGSFRAYSPSGN